MKTRNVILGLVAIVFAIGSSLASVKRPPNARTVFKNISPNSQCKNITPVCQSPGVFVCTVFVATEDDFMLLRNVYGVECTILVKSNSAAPIIVDWF